MEKCVFLDRFLHHPKDFRKIATFLKNKTTKDCIKFYYDSKKAVPYKHALKEFFQRKKRRGDVVSWDATIQSCLAMGAIIKAGSSPEKPLKFLLPQSDYTYHTQYFHPMRLEVFEALEETVLAAKQPDEIKAHTGKRKRSNWFILDAHEKKYLPSKDDDHHHHSKRSKKEAKESSAATESEEETHEDQPLKKVSRKKSSIKDTKDDAETPVREKDDDEDAAAASGGKKKKERLTPSGNKPQKWKAREKELFFDALDKHGHDWVAVSEKVGTRTATQVKNYFFDNHKTIGKMREKLAKAQSKAKKEAAAAAKEAGKAEKTATIGKKKKKIKKGKKAVKGSEKGETAKTASSATAKSTEISMPDESGMSMTRNNAGSTDAISVDSISHAEQQAQYDIQLRLQHQQGQLQQQAAQQEALARAQRENQAQQQHSMEFRLQQMRQQEIVQAAQQQHQQQMEMRLQQHMRQQGKLDLFLSR